MAKAQAVATKAATLDLAVLASDSKDASGFGNLDMSRDIAIPYINILQSNSPQLNLLSQLDTQTNYHDH